MKQTIVPNNLPIIQIPRSKGFVDLKERVKKEQENPQSEFLPYLFLNHPRESENFLFFSGKNGETKLDAPFSLVHICSRPFFRKLEGSKYTERVYAPLQNMNPEFDRLNAMSENELKESPYQKGTSHLVFIMCDGLQIFSFASLEGAETMETFWDLPLSQANVEDNKKATFNPDFSLSKTESKNGYLYYSKYKLSFKIEDFSHEDRPLLEGVAQQQKLLVKQFMER